jgi:ketosteroid isomerase-like protein
MKMTQEEEVKAATLRFYDALEAIVDGKGVGAMIEAWHHTARVTSGHPFGEWSHGWDQVLATWEELAAIGKKGSGGTKIRDLRVFVYGDVGYTIGVFTTAPSFGGQSMNVTNILHRDEGVWKIVHHHADKTPSVAAHYEKLAEEG